MSDFNILSKTFRDETLIFADVKTSVFAIDHLNETASKTESKVTSSDLSDTISENTTIWGNMMKEFYRERLEIENYREKKSKKFECSFPKGSILEYMETKVFSVLFPALTKTLIEAVRNDFATDDTCSTFDVMDSIAEYLWNNNPNYPERAEANLYIYDMPWVQELLEENPRPYFPKSSIYTPEIAAIKIQAFYRAYVVRKLEDVQEMRQFWRILKAEKAYELEYGTANNSFIM